MSEEHNTHFDVPDTSYHLQKCFTLCTYGLFTLLVSIWICCAGYGASDLVVPENLEVADFQTVEDLQLIDKFRSYQIPTFIKKIIKSEESDIVPWLRAKTGDTHDYQLTIETLRRGVMATEKQFGWVKKDVQRCAEVLHLPEIPFIFIVGDQVMYAEIVNFHDPFLLLSSDLIEKSDPAELRFVIGRELGHLKCDHVFYHTLFSGGLDSMNFALGKWVQELVKAFLGKISDLILADWVLASEISADRAGLIACQDLAAANRALINFKLAVPTNMVAISAEDYLKQAKIVDQKRQIILEKLPLTAQDAINSWERSSQLKLAQPFLFARFKALQEYANSEAYQKLLSAKSDSPNSVDSQKQ